MGELGKAWNQFWHQPIDPLPLAVLRVLTGALLVTSFVSYGLNFNSWLYGNPLFEGDLMEVLFRERAAYSFFNLAQTEFQAWVLYALHLLPALMFLVGFGGRLTTFATYVAFCSIANRNAAVTFGFDEYMATFLLVFLVNPGMSHLSLSGKGNSEGLSCTWAIRLFQVIFSLRYFSAGYYKPTEGWADGRILWEVFNNYEIWKIDVSFLYPHWNAMGSMSLSIKLFELFFVPLIVYRPTRLWAIGFGLSMHLGIGIFTPLMIFSLLMMVGYVVFVPELCRHWYNRLRLGAPGAEGPPTTIQAQSYDRSA